MLLSDIKRSAIVFLFQILDEHPEYLELPCPNVWMNARGETREAE
jgi:hypothetical protein